MLTNPQALAIALVCIVVACLAMAVFHEVAQENRGTLVGFFAIMMSAACLTAAVAATLGAIHFTLMIL